MHLSDFALQQLDKARLSALTVSQKEALLEKALEDLKEARERLQADSRPSSRPPSSDAPWLGVGEESEAEGEPRSAEEAKFGESEAESGDSTEAEKAPAEGAKSSPKRPGRRPGSPGHSRTQRLAVTETLAHRPAYGALCGGALDEREFTARTGLYVLDIAPCSGTGLSGIQLRHDQHR